MQGIFFIIVQCIACSLSTSIMKGYIIHFNKLLFCYKIVAWFINSVAIILEVVFFGNEQVFYIACVSSFLICGTMFIIFELFCSRKYFRILKSRIIDIINENNAFLKESEIRRKLVEKYDHMYAMSDIRKIMKKI